MENLKIVGYVRDTSGIKTALKNQLDEIISFAKENYNVEKEDIDIFIDTKSVFEDRVAFNEMMEKIKQGKYNVLLVSHINRLYMLYGDETGEIDQKMFKKLNSIVDEIKKHGVYIVSIREQKSI